MTVAAGLLFRTVSRMSLYVGAGYGNRQLLWQDIDGQWVRVSDWSAKWTDGGDRSHIQMEWPCIVGRCLVCRFPDIVRHYRYRILFLSFSQYGTAFQMHHLKFLRLLVQTVCLYQYRYLRIQISSIDIRTVLSAGSHIAVNCFLRITCP